MIILVVNAGSSSLKYQLIDMKDESVIAKGNCDRIGIDGHISHKTFDGRTYEADCSFPTHTEAFQKLVETLTTGDASVIKSMDEISAVGHRIVQGAEIFDKTTLVTDEVIKQIDELQELAPVHNHPHALALWACKKVIPENVPQVVVFDTAFHQTMPEKAYMFGLPYEDYEKYHVRKYGFHGTSHRFVSAALAETVGKDIKDLKIISCHLGNGSSITAIEGGKSIDTTMGFTPLDGVLMGTRTGSVDPSAVTFVAQKHGFTPNEMSDYMNKKSGFLGLSGVSSDNREVSAAAAHGDKRACLVNEMLAYQIKKDIGAYTAAMNGVDAIIFTGGIGENDPPTRENSCSDLDFFGIKIDKELNKTVRGKKCKISTPDSKVEVWVIPTNEELLIARDTLALISNK
ncbi:MAG: acetate kinase [Ruminococcus sp.]|nr:acetate kinase [Ruminococcus sp.]MDD6635454.1 acetate kinase [Ruminococcus sp.]MDY3214075.1 acetate kinase [Ruminococcus sp.]MDY3844064.1 acetate kinase [Ruminococcus sp.]CDF00473.1 acetate kinase [Ruminococcus sp. CAG:624]